MRLALAALLLCACAQPARVPRAASGPALRVLSYNVNYGLAGDAETIEAIASANADLVLLQETTRAWERALRARLSARYPHIAFHHSGGAGGQAILSRFPFRPRRLARSPVGWFPAWQLEVKTPLGAIDVLNLHLHPPVSESGSVVSGYFSSKKKRRREVVHFGRDLDLERPTLVVGDFNEGHGARATRWLKKRGLRCALEEFAPSADTWRWETWIGTLSATLDHVLYAKLEPIDARVLKVGRSDHYPVLAIFEAEPR